MTDDLVAAAEKMHAAERVAGTVTITMSRSDAEWWVVTNAGLGGPRGRLYDACRAALAESDASPTDQPEADAERGNWPETTT